MTPHTRSHSLAVPGCVGIAVTVALLTACAPSPTSTTTNSDGNTTTVDWADYPAHAGIPANDILILPRSDAVEARAEQLIGDAQAALRADYGITGWIAEQDDGWFPQEGNGYGGESLLTTFNSASYEVNVTIPVSRWDSVISTVRDVAEQYGLTHEPNNTYFEESPEGMRVGTFYQGAEFFNVILTDSSLDPEHTTEQDEDGWDAGISLFYGITTIRAEDSADFERRAAPCEGLALPEATTSD